MSIRINLSSIYTRPNSLNHPLPGLNEVDKRKKSFLTVAYNTELTSGSSSGGGVKPRGIREADKKIARENPNTPFAWGLAKNPNFNKS